MKLLERSMQLYKASAENTSAPMLPNTWTTALALYTRAVFTGLDKVVQHYNSAKLFYKENPAVADFLDGLSFAAGDCGFMLKGNVVYSRELSNPKKARSAYSPSANSAFRAPARLGGIGWQKEVFFAMKLGYAIDGVPSEHVHILKKFAGSGNLYSNLPVLYPSAQYAELTSGHIKNPIDVISYVLDIDFKPLTMERLYVTSYTCGVNAMEVYLPAEDKVAILPAELVKMLTIQDIVAIVLNDNILCLHDKPLHELCGKYGVYWKGALNLYDAD